MLVIGNIIVGKLYQLHCNFVPKLFKGLFHPRLLQLFRRKSNLAEEGPENQFNRTYRLSLA